MEGSTCGQQDPLRLGTQKSTVTILVRPSTHFFSQDTCIRLLHIYLTWQSRNLCKTMPLKTNRLNSAVLLPKPPISNDARTPSETVYASVMKFRIYCENKFCSSLFRSNLWSLNISRRPDVSSVWGGSWTCGFWTGTGESTYNCRVIRAKEVEISANLGYFHPHNSVRSLAQRRKSGTVVANSEKVNIFI